MIIRVQLRQPTTTIVNNLRSNLTRLCRLFYNVSHWYAHTTCTPVGTVLECRVQRSNESTCALRIWRKLPQRILFERVQEYGVSDPLLWAIQFSGSWTSPSLLVLNLLASKGVSFKASGLFKRVAASKLDWNLQVWDHGSQQKKGWCSHSRSGALL